MALNYAKLFPNSEKRFKYISYAGDSLTICQRLDLLYRSEGDRCNRGELAYSTYHGYKKEINRLITYFEKCHPKMRLSELQTGHLDKWGKRRNVRQKTLNEEKKHIQSIINYAIGKNHIEKNILNGWSPSVNKKILIGVNDKGEEIYKKDYEKHPFSKNEIEKILASALIVAPEQYSFILFRFALGLRPCEIIGLQWSRYNELKNSIYIKETVVLNKFKETTKTPAGERTHSLNKAAKKAIDIQKEITYNDHQFIFIDLNNNNTNHWWSVKTLEKAWKKILSHAGVPYRRAYNTRHSYATQLLKAGKSILEVSELLGHGDMRITMDSYAGGKNDDILTADEVDSFITI